VGSTRDLGARQSLSRFKDFFFFQTHLQFTNMEYGAYEIFHGKTQKINELKKK